MHRTIRQASPAILRASGTVWQMSSASVGRHTAGAGCDAYTVRSSAMAGAAPSAINLEPYICFSCHSEVMDVSRKCAPPPLKAKPAAVQPLENLSGCDPSSYCPGGQINITSPGLFIYLFVFTTQKDKTRLHISQRTDWHLQGGVEQYIKKRKRKRKHKIICFKVKTTRSSPSTWLHPRRGSIFLASSSPDAQHGATDVPLEAALFTETAKFSY